MPNCPAHKREGVHPCIVCDKAFKSLQMANQHTNWPHSGQAFVCKGCGKKFKTNNSINRHKHFLVASLTTERAIVTFPCGAKEENEGSVQLQEEGRHPLPSQLKIY